MTTQDPSQDLNAYVQACVSIIPEALEEEFIRLSSDMAYWGARYAEEHKAYLEAKVGVKRARSLAYLETREYCIQNNVKTTEALLDARVDSDLRVQLAEDTLIACEVRRAEADSTIEAVRAKKDMLISIGANNRAEMGRDPSIRRITEERTEIRTSRS